MTLILMASDRTEPVGESYWIRQYRETRQGEAFEQLYRLARRRVFATCLKLLRDFGQAEDVTHEAFLKSYERFETLEGDSFSAWVCRIASNLCLNRIRDFRTQTRLLEYSEPLEASEDQHGETAVLKAEEIRIAMKVLDTLKPEHRKVLMLRYIDECSYPEIEALTGYDRDQVRSYLQNAKRNFRNRWQVREQAAGYQENGS